MSSDSTLGSPIPCLPAVNGPQIDLTTLLTGIVGNFSLTFIRDGEIQTIGKLDTSTMGQLSSSRPCSSTPLDLDSFPESCDSSYLSEPSPLPSSPCGMNLLSTYSETASSSLNDRFAKASQASQDADFELPEHYTSSLVRQFSERPVDRPSPSQNQYPSNDCSSRTIQIIRGFFESLHIPFNEELENDIKGLRDLLWSIHHMSLKCLVSELINSLYPMRRKLHPYSQGAPIPGWPKGIRYRDPAHIGVPERLALALWIYLNPAHHPFRMVMAHRKILAKHDLDQLGLVYNVAMNMRQTLWQEQ